MESGYRVGLQVGGRGFESRTLHLYKILIRSDFLFAGAEVDNDGASALRADLSIRVRWSRARSVDVGWVRVVGRSQVTSSSGAGLAGRSSRVRVPSHAPDLYAAASHGFVAKRDA